MKDEEMDVHGTVVGRENISCSQQTHVNFPFNLFDFPKSMYEYDQ